MQEEIKLKVEENLHLRITLFHHDKPKGIVQIIHGLREHRKRYFDFASFLNEHGYVVILSDNRAHGESVNKEYFLGNMKSEEEILKDQLIISAYIKNLYPNIPFTLFGHSFGSMIARLYIQENDNLIDKLILSGTVFPRKDAKLGLFLNFPLAKFQSQKISFLSNKSVIGKNDFWIVNSKKAIKKYRKDHLCNFSYTNIGIQSIISSNVKLTKKIKKKDINSKLPILSISGELDPITGGKKGLERSFNILKKNGYFNFKNIVYPNMKHEVLNEEDNAIVYQDVLNFLDEKFK